MRSKLPIDKKRIKYSITIDSYLLDIFENYLRKNDIDNKSKYIEKLIYADILNRGIVIERDF